MAKKKKGQLYIPLKLHNGLYEDIKTSARSKIELPPRCKGLLFAFETKKAARDFMGKDARLLTITPDKGNTNE